MYLVLELCCIIMDIVNTEIAQSVIYPLWVELYNLINLSVFSLLKLLFLYLESNITSQKQNRKKKDLSWSLTLGKSQRMPQWFQAKLSPVSMRTTQAQSFISHQSSSMHFYVKRMVN